MRRHFESKHPKKKLKLPKEQDRHPCSCGRTFLEPNRLQEHMTAAGHTFKGEKKPEKKSEKRLSEKPKKKKIRLPNPDDVIDWKDMID